MGMLAPIEKTVEFGIKAFSHTAGLKVATIKVASVIGTGLTKVYTCKVVLVGGKVMWVSIKVLGAIIVGACISEVR